jgi:hypothetical protein
MAVRKQRVLRRSTYPSRITALRFSSAMLPMKNTQILREKEPASSG